MGFIEGPLLPKEYNKTMILLNCPTCGVQVESHDGIHAPNTHECVGYEPGLGYDPKANDIQIGGGHYKAPGYEEHWDRAYRLKYDNFQYVITKWIERWEYKGGIEDLRKAQHAIAKYIEVVEAREAGEPGIGYVDQDR